MDWLRRLSLKRMVLVAAIWPLLCALVAAGIAAYIFVPRHDQYTYSVVFTPSWPTLIGVLCGPSLVIAALWLVARKRHDPAT
jgi:hypothetical protein